MTLSVTHFIVTLTFTTSIIECRDAYGGILSFAIFTVMLSVVKLNVIMASVAVPTYDIVYKIWKKNYDENYELWKALPIC
jgi:hypothetical protein